MMHALIPLSLRSPSHGIEWVGELFDQQEYFVPEMRACAAALDVAIEIVKPHIRVKPERPQIRAVTEKR
jgi:dimethylamine corrinoid protein